MSVTVQGRVPRDWNDATVSHLTRRLQALERDRASGADLYSAPSVPSFGSGTITGGAGTTAPIPPPTSIPEPEVEVIPADLHPHIHLLNDLPYLLEEIRRVAEQKRPHTHNLSDVHGDADDAQRVIAGQMFGG